MVVMHLTTRHLNPAQRATRLRWDQLLTLGAPPIVRWQGPDRLMAWAYAADVALGAFCLGAMSYALMMLPG